LERVAEPLLGGIYTGDAERLSLRATMPRFVELERRHGSLIRGLRATARTRDAGARYSLFMTHADGMGGLVADLARRLPEGVVRLGSRVERLAREGDGWRVVTTGAVHDVDAVVVAVPSYVAASLLAEVDPTLAHGLAAIEYASSAIATGAPCRSTRSDTRRASPRSRRAPPPSRASHSRARRTAASASPTASAAVRPPPMRS